MIPARLRATTLFRATNLFLATALCCSGAAGQQPVSMRPELERFAALTNLQKAHVLRRIERCLLWVANPGIERIRQLAVSTADLPVADSALPTDSQSPVAVVIEAGSAGHLALRKNFPAVPFMPELQREVIYDWYGGEIVRLPPLSYEQVFENYLAGFPPGSDAALANVIAKVDAQADPKLRSIARWFAHRYVSREGQVYLGITQFEMWHSSTRTLLTVADNEAIRFARTVLGRDHYREPLPADATRDELYERMAEAFLLYRQHRSTCAAIAAATLATSPHVDVVASVLVLRMHYLLAAHGDSMPEVLAQLAAYDRDGLVEMIDGRLIDRQSDAGLILARRRQELEDMAEAIARVAREVLAEVQ